MCKNKPITKFDICGREVKCPHKTAEHHLCGKCSLKYNRNYPKMIEIVEQKVNKIEDDINGKNRES